MFWKLFLRYWSIWLGLAWQLIGAAQKDIDWQLVAAVGVNTYLPPSIQLRDFLNVKQPCTSNHPQAGFQTAISSILLCPAYHAFELAPQCVPRRKLACNYGASYRWNCLVSPGIDHGGGWIQNGIWKPVRHRDLLWYDQWKAWDNYRAEKILAQNILSAACPWISPVKNCIRHFFHFST